MTTRTRLAHIFRALLLAMCYLAVSGWMAEAQLRINTVVSDSTSVSKGQTGIVVHVDVENISAVSLSLDAVGLIFRMSGVDTSGSYEATLNQPVLPLTLNPGERADCVITVSVKTLADSGYCEIDGWARSGVASYSNALLKHTWAVQEPSELVLSSVLGPSVVNRGSSGNSVIVDVGRSGEAGAWLRGVDLSPWTPSNYLSWALLSPSLPKNFGRSYWWDKRWSYRQQLTITNQSLSTLPATYEIRVVFKHAPLVTAGKSLANGNDVRVVFDNGISYQEIPRYCEQEGATTWTAAGTWASDTTVLWFRLQEPLGPAPAATQKYAIYYGNPAAGAPPGNASDVFTFFDSFENGNLGWTTARTAAGVARAYISWSNGTPTVGPAAAHSPTNAWGVRLNGNYPDSGTATIELNWLRSPAIDLRGKLRPQLTFWDYLNVESPVADYDKGILSIHRSPPAGTGDASADGYTLDTLESSYIREHFTWQKQTYQLKNSLTSEVIYLHLGFACDWAANDTIGWMVDNFRIRQVADRDPIIGFGVEEPAPILPTIKAYFDVSVTETAVAGLDTIDALATGTEANTGNDISDFSASPLYLNWTIQSQNFSTYGTPFYVSPKNIFNLGESVYGKGSGYTPGQSYRIIWVNPSGNTVASPSIVADTGGNLYNTRTLSTSDLSGRWLIRVENPAGTVVYMQTTFDVNTPAYLVSELSVPDSLITGQSFSISHIVTNAGQSDAVGVVPTVPAITGGGTVLSLTGPSPSAWEIPGGESRTFTYNAIAGNAGRFWVRANAQGTIQGSAETVTSASAGSNISTIRTELMQSHLVVASATMVNRGQTNLALMGALINSGTADLVIASMSPRFLKGASDVSSNYSSTLISPALPATVPGISFPPWWNTAYQYRQKLRITSDNVTYAASCTAFIKLDLNTLIAANKLQATYNDWRVLRWDDLLATWTELDRDRIDSEQTAFAIRSSILPNGRDESYFVYYGNSTAGAPPSNKRRCYLWFEDFETPVYAAGWTRLGNGALAFTGWTGADGGQDGIYATRGVMSRPPGSQSIAFRRIFFGNVATNTANFARFFRTTDTTNYPRLRISFWRWYDDACDWQGGASVNYDWARLRFLDNLNVWNQIIFYPSNGPDDDTWRFEEYDLSSMLVGPATQFSWDGNFSWNAADNNDRIYFDDICVWMRTPAAVPLGEETQPVTTLAATFSVNVGVTAPTGSTTLDLAATATSALATGTYTDLTANTPDEWLVATITLTTWADAAGTIPQSEFARGQTVYVRGTGFTPGGGNVTINWIDGYPTGTIRNTTILPEAGGAISGSAVPAAAGDFGTWRLAATQGAVTATGSFRLLERPAFMPFFHLTPATSTVGDILTAGLTIHAAPFAETFESGLGSWTLTGTNPPVATLTQVYNWNYPQKYVLMTRTVADTESITTTTVKLQGVFDAVLHFDYSLVLPTAATLSVSISANGGTNWLSLATYTTSTGSGTWVSQALTLPTTVCDNKTVGLRFSFTHGANGRAMLDNVFISGLSQNHESVSLSPVNWVATGSGNALIATAPVPSLATVSIGTPVTFATTYTTIATTTATSSFYLQGTGTPRILAVGTTSVGASSWNVSDALSDGVNIYRRAMQITPSLIDFGNVNPGARSATGSLSIRNVGNLNLSAIKWEFHDLTANTDLIPLSAVSASPDPVGALAVGVATAAGVSVFVPAATSPGSYTASQFVFEDVNFDGNSAGEPIATFETRISVPIFEGLQCATNTIDLGDWRPGDTVSTTSITVTNIGNQNLPMVFLQVSSFTTGVFWIASDNVKISPNQYVGLMVKGTSSNKSFSVQIPGGQATGTYIATATFINEKVTVNAIPEPGEASFPIRLTLYVTGSESMSLGSTTVILATSTPGTQVATGLIRLRNLGDLGLEKLKIEWNPLTFAGPGTGSLTIASSCLRIVPDPLPIVNKNASTTFSVAVDIPFGVASSAVGSPFSGVQWVFNDRNGNNIRDAGETAASFTLRLGISQLPAVVVAEELANFGTGVQGAVKTCQVSIMNTGNSACSGLKWRVLDQLTDGTNIIASTAVTFLPNGVNPASWVFNFPSVTSTTATLTLTIPGGVPAGVYQGRCCLFNDVVTVNNASNTGESYDEFTLRIEVGSGTLRFATDSMDLGWANPYEDSAPSVFSVTNQGSSLLDKVRYQKANLIEQTVPANLISVPNHHYSSPDPIGLMLPGMSIAPTIHISVPAAQPAGTYSTILDVFQDDNLNGLIESGEASDTMLFTLHINSHKSLTWNPLPFDMGGVDRGKSASVTLELWNVGNLPITNLTLQPTAMICGADIIATANITLTPAGPWNLAPNATQALVVTVNTLPSTPTGNYRAWFNCWEDGAAPNGVYNPGEASWPMSVDLAVGGKALRILEPTTLDFGVVTRGSDTITLNFVIQNTGTAVPLSKLRIQPANLTYGLGSIATTTFVFSPSSITPPNLNPGVKRSVSMMIHTPDTASPGSYVGDQIVFEDENGDGICQSTEASATFKVKVGLTKGDPFGYEMTVDPGLIDNTWRVGGVGPTRAYGLRGQTMVATFTLTSLCFNTLNTLDYAPAVNLTGPGAPIPPVYAPAAPFTLTSFQSRPATVSVSIPAGQAAGFYSCTQHIDDLTSVAEADIVLQLIVASSAVSVSPSPLNFGYVPPGQAATLACTISSIGSAPFRIAHGFGLGLIGPQTIPAASLTLTLEAWPPDIGAAPATMLGSVTVQVDMGVIPGNYVGTMTIYDLDFPNEASFTVPLRVNVISPIGDFVYQLVTNASQPGSVVSGESYIVSVYAMATGTVSGNVVLQVREWLQDDMLTPAATHTVTFPGADLSAQRGRWVRLWTSFTATTSANLGSFTVELGVLGAGSGQGVYFDGVQFEKAITFPSGQRSTEPTPYTPHKSVVSPSELQDLGTGRRYYSW